VGGKNKNQTVTAVWRELLGFIWGIALKDGTKLSGTTGRLKSGRRDCSLYTEGQVDGSGRANEKENSPTFYAVPPSGPIRAASPRQLPTDHDLAVPARVYQSDQSSRKLHRCHLSGLPKYKRLALPASEEPASKSDLQTSEGLTGSLKIRTRRARRVARCGLHRLGTAGRKRSPLPWYRRYKGSCD
jgi:hypothetical protein